MQTQNPLFDQFARLMTDAAGAANGVREEFETLLKRQAERLIADMELVPREEFEAVRDLASAARIENDQLRQMIEQLEQRLLKLEGAERRD